MKVVVLYEIIKRNACIKFQSCKRFTLISFSLEQRNEKNKYIYCKQEMLILDVFPNKYVGC